MKPFAALVLNQSRCQDRSSTLLTISSMLSNSFPKLSQTYEFRFLWRCYAVGPTPLGITNTIQAKIRGFSR